MKLNLFLIIIISSVFSCKKNYSERSHNLENFNKFNLTYSNSDYRLNLTTGKFKIDFYKFSDTVKLTEEQKNRIAKIFFENYIDTLKNYVSIVNKEEPYIMPDFGDSFSVSENNKHKSFIKISGQDFTKTKSLNEKDKSILKFKKDLFSILNENGDFKNCMDTLKKAKKNDKRIFL